MTALALLAVFALTAQTPPPTDLRSVFQNPPAAYRSMPLWVWNDELDWLRLKEQLAQFHKQGMGGVFVHPRPGLMTEYLGPDWFKLWKLSVDEGRRLGMFINIYDENSYPAGFAGGHVPSRAPDTVAQFVQAELGADPTRISSALAAFGVTTNPDGSVRSARRIQKRSELAASDTALAFRLRRASGNPWTGGFPYVDLTNPETARQFIATTFEAYKRHLGAEFGNTIRWVFDDEPLLATGGAYDNAPLALPLSYYTLAEFRKRCGYDLADHLPSLYWDVGDFQKVRFDYWQTLHDLWKENYFQPLYRWCNRNGLQFTGHWMEHEWPYPWISPDDASFYAFEHAPGIDMLEGANIRMKGSDPHMLFTIKQVASVAHQLGRRAFCEAYGVSGWDSTLEHYKRFGDWLMVHGIDFIDQHLAFASVRGARKRDHPQSFTDVSPWWPYYKLHGDHVGRACYMLSRGAARNRLLLVEPTTSGFLWARRGGRTPELETMRHDNAELIQFLADRQVDFDLGDEYILDWFGKQVGKQIVIGEAPYDLIVWPANMINVRHQTVPLIEKYLAAGGEILALAPPAQFIDGRAGDAAANLASRPGWHSVSSLDELLSEVTKRLPPRVRFDPPLGRNVGLNERFLASGERVLFLANTGLQPVKSRLIAEGAIESWDTITGKVAASSGDVDLAPAGSQMFVLKKSPATAKPAPPPSFAPLEFQISKITTGAPNVLVLDYCDLAAPSLELRDVNTWQANWRLWQIHGFERPAWDNAVQFKTRIFDRNHFGPNTGFTATFRFEAAAEALAGLELAVESPELYKVAVNGKPVSFVKASRWLDPHIKSVGIEQLARAGENVVTIAGRPFDVRMELENIYLRGNFTVAAQDKGYRLAAPAKLALGSWAKQGWTFYGDSAIYEGTVNVVAAGRIRVELGEWQGSAAEVLLDGKQAAVLGWQPYIAEFAAIAGRHTVGLRIVSTPRNIFGPFHNPTKPRMRAWPAAWADFPDHQPPGAQYDVLDYGLMTPFKVEAR